MNRDARNGRLRETPLIGIPDGERIILIACDWYYDDDGSFVLQTRLPAGALFVEALAAAAESVPAVTPAP